MAETNRTNESRVKWRHIKPGDKGEEECEPRQMQDMVLPSIKLKH